MLCRHCGRKIPLLKRLGDAEFCSPAHRDAFLQVEQEAAMARLLQNGTKLAQPQVAAAPPAKSKQGSKKHVGKGEIPAPLAGLLPEANCRPKVKNKTVSFASMHAWEVYQALPESPAVIMARKLDFAEGILIEPQPARTRTLVHAVPDAEAVPGDWFEPVALTPLAAESGQEPAAAEAVARGLEPERQMAGPASEPVQPRQGLAEPQVFEFMLLDSVAACPLPAAGTVVDVKPQPCGVIVESRAPRMSARPDRDLDVAEAWAAQSGMGTEAAWQFNDAGPAPCGLAGLPAAGIRAVSRPRSPLAETLVETGRLPLVPRAGIDLARAAIRRVESLMEVELGVRPAPPSAFKSHEKALRPKRRLIGPRMKDGSKWMAGVPEAGLAVPGVAVPVRAGRSCLPGARTPAALEQAEPRIPATQGLEDQVSPEPAALAEITGHRPWALSGREQARVSAVPDWPAAATLLPGAGLSVEETMTFKTEVSGAAVMAPEIQGPPLFDRLLPIFASRGLAGLSESPRGVDFLEGPAWGLSLSRPPSNRASSLAVDHADGSGSRMAAAFSKSNRPWYSIQLPSFQFTSWKNAPADLKWIMVALPMILVIALYSFLPPRTKNSVETAAEAPSQPTVLSQRFEAIRTAIMERAAIRLVDDFRSGLGAWQGPGGWAQTWTYNSANYAVPGQLALYQPSLGLRDYVFGFLGQIDRRSINWVVRARDERNYLAMRIVMTRSGPLPAASLVRYAVVDGRVGRQTALPLPMTFRDGTMQQVEVTVAGDTITTRIMGQIVDSFTETELDSGGVGFFSPKGDRALLRWISVTHQYDYIGRLCALLAPHAVMSREAGKTE